MDVTLRKRNRDTSLLKLGEYGAIDGVLGLKDLLGHPVAETDIDGGIAEPFDAAMLHQLSSIDSQLLTIQNTCTADDLKLMVTVSPR